MDTLCIFMFFELPEARVLDVSAVIDACQIIERSFDEQCFDRVIQSTIIQSNHDEARTFKSPLINCNPRADHDAPIWFYMI